MNAFQTDISSPTANRREGLGPSFLACAREFSLRPTRDDGESFCADWRSAHTFRAERAPKLPFRKRSPVLRSWMWTADLTNRLQFYNDLECWTLKCFQTEKNLLFQIRLVSNPVIYRIIFIYLFRFIYFYLIRDGFLAWPGYYQRGRYPVRRNQKMFFPFDHLRAFLAIWSKTESKGAA